MSPMAPPRASTARARRRAQLETPGEVATRKDASLVSYPRAEQRMPDGELFGLFDIARIVNVRRNTAIRWVERLSLPPADGPSIDDRPTWTRPTVVMWLMARNTLPDDLVDEYERLMADPQMRTRFNQIVAECG